jgi:AcrR family transcriptional regulator
MNELAQDLGVGRATLYRWVGGREQLLGEVLWSMAERGLNLARAEARGRGAKWVLDIYRRFGDLIVETPSVRHFVSTEREAALRVMTSAPSPLQRRVIDTFVDVLREAEATKGLKLRIDAETLAYVLVRVAESFLWTDLITGEPPNLTKALEVAEVLLS